MKLIVTGGRAFNGVAQLHAALDYLRPTLIIHGDCLTGADRIADQWAKREGVARDPLPADWNDMSPPCRVKYDRSGREYNALAGFKRNSQLLTRGAARILGTDGGPGTADMLQKAYIAGLQIWRLRAWTLYGPCGDEIELT
ncbi:SLOG family protein [Sphingopyxis sp. GW247-27LB]|uniref:SLOG family protein n=1 Tax=Sphingopyxis sp. GW247-27LB TaxID=2012632 RepID=UPI000BA5844E|nr:SLOG family protein [Sphingopyxis sp. GW247-27LB]PAL23567.1 hypothetical protein CD928_05735 [Sphingopyxis sp. GW247-27LB]